MGSSLIEYEVSKACRQRSAPLWIQTYTGRRFWPLEPRAQDVDIRDIAHALSMKCRFMGHCQVFYSVADHSVRVSELVQREHALWGLLHDGAEAFFVDVARPIKHSIPAINTVEDRILKVIAEAFGLDWPVPDKVEIADTLMLAAELRDLMVEPEVPWDIDVDWSVVPKPVVLPRTQSASESEFLARYSQLESMR